MANDRDPNTTTPAERELVISRVFDAPREFVFKAWTEPEHIELERTRILEGEDASTAERSVPPPSRRIEMLGSQQESVSDELE